MQEDPNILGVGSYGAVRKDGDIAIKKFEKIGHLIQEIIAGYYLRNASHVVRMHSFNLNSLELSMELCDDSLRKLLNSSEPFDRWSILQDILYGFLELHQRHLVHGDIKPGNNLIKYENAVSPRSPRAIIADLGFVSLGPYSKASRCARSYRELKVKAYYGHDIYSLAVMMLELLSGYKVRRQLKYSTLHRRIRKHLAGIVAPSGEEIVPIVLSMTSTDYYQRPTAAQLLQLFYKEVADVKRLNLSEEPPFEYKQDSNALLMKRLSKQYGIKRAKRGYRILLDNKLNDAMHTRAMAVILISLFSRRSYGEERKQDAGKYMKNETLVCNAELKDAIGDLLTTEGFIDSILLPAK